MAPTPAEKNVLTVLESCFKIVPGMEAELAELQGRFWPVATSQPGFVSVGIGPIVNSTWFYFGVRFESKNQMDAWHRHPGHQAIQKMGYAKFWTALYLRKWRVALPGEALGERLLCETRLVTKSPLTPEQLASLKPMLDRIGDAGTLPFETLTGEYEPQPYQFVAPVQITPAVDGAMYALITHSSSASAIEAWRESPGYRFSRRSATSAARPSSPQSRTKSATDCGPTGCSATGCSPATPERAAHLGRLSYVQFWTARVQEGAMRHELGTAAFALPTAGQLRELETRIGIRLNGRIRNFRLSLRDGGMVLEGRAQTYHAKQLAQHAVMEASDLPISVNDIEVV